MARFSLTIDAEHRTALEKLSKVEGRPIDQLLNEAVESYLNRRLLEQNNWEANLSALREYRTQDPTFQRAIDVFVEAEATLEDPVEGEPLTGEFIGEEFRPAGPVQSKIRDLLGA